MKQSEQSVHLQVAMYLKYQYLDVIFRTDFAAGVRMTMHQAVKHKALQSGRAYPDLFIAQPMSHVSMDRYATVTYHGLFLELKRPGTVLTRPKDAKAPLKGETKLRLKGDWFDGHIEEQAEMLQRLRKLGYKAEFCCGFSEAKAIIDEYLKP